MRAQPVISPATRQDFLDYSGALPACRVRAWAARLDGRVIGIGGVFYAPNGGLYAFLDLSDEARAFPRCLHRTGLSFMREMRQSGLGPIAATTTTDVPRADAWLERLGFVKHEVGGTKVFVHAAQPDG